MPRQHERLLPIEARTFAFGEPLPAADVIFVGALIHWVFCLTTNFQGDFGRILSYLASRAQRPARRSVAHH